MGFSPLPVEEKALSWTWHAARMSMKKHEPQMLRAMELFPQPVEQKAISVLPGNARDGLSPLPVEEKAISGSTGIPKSGPFRMILDADFDPSRLPLPP